MSYLVITVRFLNGKYHGHQDRFTDHDGWPPSPARLFQALVSGAAVGKNISDGTRHVLLWLEQLEAPRILAPVIHRGKVVKYFVPNNDLDFVNGDPNRISEIRVSKRECKGYFDETIPLSYIWPVENLGDKKKEIRELCQHLYQLGRGFDFAWADSTTIEDDETIDELISNYEGQLWVPGGEGIVPCPTRGSFASLSSRFKENLSRMQISARKNQRITRFINPPKPKFRQIGYNFSYQPLVLEIRNRHSFEAQSLRSVYQLVSKIKELANANLSKALPDSARLIGRVIVGQGASEIDKDSRVFVIPIPSIGMKFTDPSIRRFMVSYPNNCPIRYDDLEWGFTGLEINNPSMETTSLVRTTKTEDYSMLKRYSRPARIFQSITAVATPTAQRKRISPSIRDAKSGTERNKEEVTAIFAVRQALRHAKIRTEVDSIKVQREPFHRKGVRAEDFAVGTRFSKHCMWHVEIKFRKVHRGPLIIGDGRYAGLGLLVPMGNCEDIWSFSLSESTKFSPTKFKDVVFALRRALMSRSSALKNGRVDPLFSGHGQNSLTSATREHLHVFISIYREIVDNVLRTRIVIVPPWSVFHRKFGEKHSTHDISNQRRHFDNVVTSLSYVTMGKLGRLTLPQPTTVEIDDPLVKMSTKWKSESRFLATHHLPKNSKLKKFLKKNIILECKRRNIPTPESVEILDAYVGPKGGNPSCNAVVNFKIAIAGPIILGRDSHSGGGLFLAND